MHATQVKGQLHCSMGVRNGGLQEQNRTDLRVRDTATSKAQSILADLCGEREIRPSRSGHSAYPSNYTLLPVEPRETRAVPELSYLDDQCLQEFDSADPQLSPKQAQTFFSTRSQPSLSLEASMPVQEMYCPPAATMSQKVDENSNLMLLLGNDLIEAKNFDLAIEVLKSGLLNLENPPHCQAAGETNALLYLAMGEALMKTELRKEAISCYLKGLKFTTANTHTKTLLLDHLAIAHYENNDYESAIPELELLVAVEDISGEAKAAWYSYLVNAYMQKGDLNSAAEAIKKGLRLEIPVDTRADFLNVLGRIGLVNGEVIESKEYFRMVLDVLDEVSNQIKAEASCFLSEALMREALLISQNASTLSGISQEVKGQLDLRVDKCSEALNGLTYNGNL